MNISQEHLYGRFQAVFTTYYNSLCNYAFTFVKDKDVSEDIVQELFMKIWEGRRELILQDSVRYYLFTAVRNNSISYIRKQKNTEEWNGEEIPDEVIPEKEGRSEEEYRQLLQKGIDRLPPKCREIFLLSRFSNMTYKQIAGSLNISVKTVENQLGKALKSLRGFLKKEGLYLVGPLIGFFL
jgi:RNA polymerase sigma-70 factor (family 1)